MQIEGIKVLVADCLDTSESGMCDKTARIFAICWAVSFMCMYFDEEESYPLADIIYFIYVI